MKKAYRYLDRRFHPDKNQHFNCTDLMKMINQSKEELGDALRNNDAMRDQERVRMDATGEEKRVCMAYNSIIISSDDESDSGRRQIPSKPVTSSNKTSTFPAKHKSNNEETPLKKTDQVPFTLKQ